ncbi:hypothetical protein [Azospirillum halopraeferens]|uniref:hypothetical protein n=1 Tax=Azospirillum halopraeferens TaxID=34010 RepID=UPI00040EF4CC|nr:hypothetical protein [Azospirillum halopraeferens]
MAEISDTPPFVRHHDVAGTLVRTIHEAMAPQLNARGVVTREELGRAFGALMEQWPRALPLFARTCRTCTERGAPHATPVADPADEGRRRDFVTRLIFSTVPGTVPEEVDPLTGALFPRVAVPGLQATLAGLFYEKEWEAMNADAVAVFRQIGSGRDAEVWERIRRHITLPAVAGAVFVRVLLRFKQFHFQRQSFVRRMTETLRDQRFTFTDAHFDALFEAMFGHLREDLASELGRARIDVRYGEDTAGHLLRIFEQFDKRRQEATLPVRSVGGALRPAALPRRSGGR